jgi:uncharacterized membrane protein
MTYQEDFTGPLPHPLHLKAYEQIAPGAANKIITLAEEQAKHRRELEKAVIISDIHNERRGMNYAFLLTLVMMLIGGFLVYNGKSVIGFLSIFAPAIFGASSFYYKKRNEKKELAEKEKQ